MCPSETLTEPLRCSWRTFYGWQIWWSCRCNRYVKFAGAATTSLVAGLFLQFYVFRSNAYRVIQLQSVSLVAPWNAPDLTVTLWKVIMILRVYALYLGNRIILISLLALLAGQIIVSSWAVHNGKRKLWFYLFLLVLMNYEHRSATTCEFSRLDFALNKIYLLTNF